MATGRGKGAKKVAESLAPQADPRAPLDGRVFLDAAKPVLAALTEDLLARADGSAGVTRALRLRHAKEREQERTADGYEVWRRQVVVQVAAAWLLSCVFVRTLEDRGLLARMRIAGAGARDGQQMFFQIAPYLTERDYLLAVFREVAHLDAVRGLFARERSLVWRLAPSAEGARKLLELFRAGDAEAPAFRFGQADTRFLGDLYQDLNEEVRERFALLQTPDFVEEFILDRTLEPAIEKFGLERTEIIDPTCGSGHFLLGAFGRLVERRLREEPGVDPVVAATKALEAVYGVDVNPYAVMIARFRLTLAWLEKAGFSRLEGVGRVEPKVVVADSLLHNVQLEQRSLVELEGVALGDWELEAYRLEDDARAKEVLGKGYAAVVGNPPYITVKDPVLRERYRAMYKRSAAGKYSIAAPFTERFFQLARAGGRVGMITANSFMKREFGKKLIEQYLPTVNLDVIVNTSGAYIPGHGTPTVLLFGSQEKPVGEEVLTVLANRGEPATPEDPRQGVVWGSIAGHWNEVGYEDEYVSVVRTGREGLGKHPWSLGGGGAAELKEWLEERASGILGDRATAIGYDAIMGEDDIFVGSQDWTSRLDESGYHIRIFIEGAMIRDWAMDDSLRAIFPYDKSLQPSLANSKISQHFWQFRTNLINRMQFGKNTLEAGLTWFEYRSFYKSKRSTSLSITFAFVATHNHFVLDRGGKVFKQTAPIIKLPETATEDDHLALLAYLNSSTACFWMKQVCQARTVTTGEKILQPDPAKIAYEFASTQLQPLPVPRQLFGDLAIACARQIDSLARARAQLPSEAVDRLATVQREDAVAAATNKDKTLLARQCILQELLDAFTYADFGLIPNEDHQALGALAVAILGDDAAILSPDGRPFLNPDDLGALPQHVRKLVELLARQPAIKPIEDPAYKRRWIGRQGRFRAEGSELRDEVESIAAERLLAAIERIFSTTAQCLGKAEIIHAINQDPTTTHLAATDTTIEQLCSDLPDAVPFSSALVFTDTGIEKREKWRRCWNAQRAEDRGEKPFIEVPPKYGQNDYVSADYYRLRGKLDVPKERFIAYPGCSSLHDPSPVYGWAGWDHAQRAQALAQLYLARKTEEAWPAERLTPMLAGLDELIFWLELWHGDPHPDYGIPLSSFYADFISSECRELGLTLDDLRSWRPPKGFGKPAKPPKPPKPERAARKKAPETPDDEVSPAADPPTFALTADPPRASKPPRLRKPRAPKQPPT